MVRTKYPIKKALQKGTSTRMVIWSQELSEYGIEYQPRIAIKGQAIADFIAEFAYNVDLDQDGKIDEEPKASKKRKAIPDGPVWSLHVDGASNVRGSGAGIVFMNPDGEKMKYAIHFQFKASNNEAEYEALLAGLDMARKLGVENLKVHCDSLLIVNQVKGEYQAKEENMIAYLEETKLRLKAISWYEIVQVPRESNTEADALAQMASGADDENLGKVPVETMKHPSIKKEEVNTIENDPKPNWMTPIIDYLREDTLPSNQAEARKVKYQAQRYVLRGTTLYKRGFSQPLLRCLDETEANYVLREIHEGICGNHSAGHSLTLKTLKQGYFWPTLKKDAFELAKKCDKCQRFSHIPRQPPAPLCPILVARPFAKWGVDIIGKLPMASGQRVYAIVAIDYFTKWVEAEPLAKITEANTTNFMWRSIICRHGIPASIITDNGCQFDNKKVREICKQLKIIKTFSSPRHPQANGQVEAVNKTIKETLKKKLEEKKGAWADELPLVLWAYRTTTRTATGETPFSLSYGVEAVIPVEIGTPSFRMETFDEENNNEALRMELDVIEERRVAAFTRMAAQKRVVEKHYNSKVKARRFTEGGLILRKVFQNTQVHGAGVLGPNWEGPYRVRQVIRDGTYRLEEMDGTEIKHPWNAEHLRQYFQ